MLINTIVTEQCCLGFLVFCVFLVVVVCLVFVFLSIIIIFRM